MSKLSIMQVNLGIWTKLNRVLLVLMGAAALLAMFFWYLPLIQQNELYRKRIFDLDTKLEAERKLSVQLRAAADALQHDPRTLERLARERLGYARSNETVIRFESEK